MVKQITLRMQLQEGEPERNPEDCHIILEAEQVLEIKGSYVRVADSELVADIRSRNAASRVQDMSSRVEDIFEGILAAETEAAALDIVLKKYYLE